MTEFEPITQREFESIAGLIYSTTGIALAPTKKPLVLSRLAKRLRALELNSFSEYFERAQTDAVELQEFINALTTNKTEFFREAVQFDDLKHSMVPVWRDRKRARIWCAASSTGEEAWTLAMSVWDSLPDPLRADVRILATDIDTNVLERAKAGVYAADRVGGLSREALTKHFERTSEGWAVRDHLRRWVDFRQLNLVAQQWPHRQVFDSIFCRNVMIYFDHETRDGLLRRFANHLAADGRLYVGLSEAVHWMPEVWRGVGPSTYVHAGEAPVPRASVPPPPPRPSITPSHRGPPGVDALPRERIIVGDVEARATPTVLATLLGSCVAIGLTDPIRGVGGLNHFLLPDAQDIDPARVASYGAYAIELLINAVLQAGGVRKNLQAKVFGGGRVLQTTQREHVGARNLAFAREFLEKDGIPIAAVREGGEGGLDVSFVTSTGQAFVRPIPVVQLADTARDEQKLRKQINAPPSADVELFE